LKKAGPALWARDDSQLSSRLEQQRCDRGTCFSFF